MLVRFVGPGEERSMLITEAGLLPPDSERAEPRAGGGGGRDTEDGEVRG